MGLLDRFRRRRSPDRDPGRPGPDWDTSPQTPSTAPVDPSLTAAWASAPREQPVDFTPAEDEPEDEEEPPPVAPG
jgi:hypothetical protein